MTSTLVRNSVVGDDWIKEVCANNPTALLPGEARNITTGPCRLAFTDALLTPQTPTNNPQGTPKFSVCALYTPFTDMNVFYGEYYRVCGEMFPEFYNREANQYFGLETPFHDGASKSHKFEGFTPGVPYINHTSKFKPAIVTPPRGPGMQPEPVVDPSKVYPGVWAILVVNAYGYGKSPPQPKKGVSFGLQAVMLIGDDTNLSGGGIDPAAAFAGAVVKPPAVNPAALAGAVPPPPAGAPPMPGTGRGNFAAPPPPSPMVAGMAGNTPADDDLSALM